MDKHPPQTAYGNFDDPHDFNRANPCLSIIDISPQSITQESQSDFEPDAIIESFASETAGSSVL